MYNQSCGCQNNFNQTSQCTHCTSNNCGRTNCMQSSGNNWMNQWGQNICSDTTNGCPRPQPVVAPRKVCVSQQITPVAQPVICPIECRRVNRCMYYPVYYPQYEQTFVNMPY